MLANALDGPVLQSSSLGSLAPALGPRPAAAPGISTERTEAVLAGANRIITGYVERFRGKIRIAAMEEEVPTHQTRRTLIATDSSPAAALEQLAHDFSPRSGRLLSSNAEALRVFATALEVPSTTRTELLEQGVRLDPNFGQAWFGLANQYLAHGDRAAFENTIDRARQHNLDARSRANLDLAASELSADRAVRIAALRKVSDLNTADTRLMRELADGEIAIGQFKEGAKDWLRVIAVVPTDGIAWNSLGYARSYAGDYAGALAALREYERLQPHDANPTDSIGDLNYSFRRFREAADDYLEAHKKQPGFNQNAELYKAAWAKFRAGDKGGADSLFAQYRAERLKSAPADELAELLTADWLYRTGRQSEGIAAERKLIAATRSAAVQINAYTQLAIWDFLQNDRAQALKDAVGTGVKPAGLPVIIVRFASQPSAAAEEWEARALHAFPGDVNPRRSALGWALLFDGKREPATAVWREIDAATSATDFFTHAIYARLQGKTPERPMLPDPVNFNEFAAVLDKL